MSTTKTRRQKVGHPTRCTDPVTEKIIEAVKAGNALRHASEYAGVHPDAASNWQTRGRYALADAGFDIEADELDLVGPTQQLPQHIIDALPENEIPFVRFTLRLRKAKATAVVRMVTEIAADKSWQAKAWLLERRHPEEWGRRRLEITGADGGPIQLQAVREELLERIGRYEEPQVVEVRLGGTPRVELPTASNGSGNGDAPETGA